MPPRRKRALPPWLGVLTNSTENTESNNDDNTTESDQKKPGKLAGSSAGAKKIKLRLPSPPEDKQIDKQPCLTAAQIVEMSYPVYSFKGSIIYSYNKGECNLLCEDLLSEICTSEQSVVGFDMEWPVTYERDKQGKTALIQIAPSVNKCYLFHVSCMSQFPSILRKLITSNAVKKVGLNITNDLWKLESDYDVRAMDIIKKSAIELRTLANQKLKSSENWSLEGLTKNILRQRISKDPSVRKCDWSHFPLSEEQQRYAATDAVVSLMLYLKLDQMGRASAQ